MVFDIIITKSSLSRRVSWVLDPFAYPFFLNPKIASLALEIRLVYLENSDSPSHHKILGTVRKQIFYSSMMHMALDHWRDVSNFH